MIDRTRLCAPESGANKVFALFVEDWRRRGEPLLDALVMARTTPGCSATCESLLRTPAVAELIEAWEIWECWLGIIYPEEAEARPAPFLTLPMVRRLRFALWGWGSGA
ncbi:hypothetical protein [Iamia sp.]|uniref:hypothetical protein n=1 Tax=Iamia sp. TaxID=2722710 RepID=UPI002CB51319|nr:hypothetical protein [Iamia sp.]HXH58990.1 hypothetical protein [Iamia sp.]